MTKVTGGERRFMSVRSVLHREEYYAIHCLSSVLIVANLRYNMTVVTIGAH